MTAKDNVVMTAKEDPRDQKQRLTNLLVLIAGIDMIIETNNGDNGRRKSYANALPRDGPWNSQKRAMRELQKQALKKIGMKSSTIWQEGNKLTKTRGTKKRRPRPKSFVT